MTTILHISDLHFGTEVPQAVEALVRLALPDVRIAGMHTARAWRHVVGHVTAAQATRSAAWLAEGPAEALRIVVTHHPLAVPDAQDHAQLLRGAELALPQWLQAGAHLALGGHIHRPYFMPLQGCRAAARQRLWVAQAGTAVSHRLRAPWPHSVNLLRRVAPSRWQLQRWNLDPGRGDFALHEEVALDTLASR